MRVANKKSATPELLCRHDSRRFAAAVNRLGVHDNLYALYKAELIRKDGPWRGLDDIEFATLDYIDWFNHRRLHGEIGMIPPAEFEEAFCTQTTPAPLVATQ